MERQKHTLNKDEFQYHYRKYEWALCNPCTLICLLPRLHQEYNDPHRGEWKTFYKPNLDMRPESPSLYTLENAIDYGGG